MAVVTFRDLYRGLRELGLGPDSRVIAHVSLPALGQVRGGAEAVVAALTSLCGLSVMPVFTYQCLVRPQVGPENNGTVYGDFFEDNAGAEFYRADLPAHPEAGLVAETLRQMKGAVRSSHPLLSFAAWGVGAEVAMSAQSLAEPLGPIAHLADAGGDALLLGVDHTRNMALHYAEYRAGRKQFIRWALTLQGVVECVAWPGCSQGFNAIQPRIGSLTRSTRIGPAAAQRLPLGDLLQVAEAWIRDDPTALLCRRPECECCNAVRAAPKAVTTPAG